MFPQPDVSSNLQTLRQRLNNYLLLGLIGISSLEAWFLLPWEPFDGRQFLLWLSLDAGAVGAYLLRGKHPRLSRHLLVWGLLAWFLAAMLHFPEPWIPFFGLVCLFAAALLVPYAMFVYAAAIVAAALQLNAAGLRGYPAGALVLLYLLGLLIAFLQQRTVFTALNWAWAMQERAGCLLDETRTHRAELGRTLKSLEIAHAIQRKIQDELIVARKQADEARRMKEKFAANISHELRTPLNLILGFSEVMYKSPETYGSVTWPPTLRRDVYQIYRSSEHLLQMIDDILDLSRYELLDFSLSKEPTPLKTPILEAVEIVSDLFHGPAIALVVDLEPDLPVLELDSTRIRQVLINLLKNARSFTSEGSVTVSARQEDGQVLISVKDTGEGIPKEKLPAIFDEFYQVDQSRARKRQGAGLGLAICKRFVEAHEGRIWVESEEGAGAQFFFTLPRPLHQYHDYVVDEGRFFEGMLPVSRRCVLVVDPDRTVVGMVSRRLDDFDVIQVERIEALEEQIERFRPRAVIVNTLPGAPPVRLPETHPVPVIQASLPSQDWLVKQLSVSASLAKPVTAAQLGRFLSGRELVRKILIVDDDREFVILMTRYLQANGAPYEVQSAYDGEAGLEAMRRFRPDLVLLDIVMPGMNGFEVLEAMQNDPDLARIEVALVSGSNFAEDMQNRLDNQMHVTQSGGLSYAQVLDCMGALVNVLGKTIAE